MVLGAMAPKSVQSAGLEVAREDCVCLEGAREAVDLLGHVGRDHALVVAAELLGARLELVVEAVALVLGEDVGLAPLALGAAERDVPALRARLLPLHRVDEGRGAVDADVELALGVGGRRSRLGRGRLDLRAANSGAVEVDDLDRLAARQDDALELVVSGARGRHLNLLRAPYRHLAPQLERTCVQMRTRVENCLRAARDTVPRVVLSDRTIREEIEAGRIVVEPFDSDLVQPSSIDLRVDRRFRVFQNARYPYIDVRQRMDDLTELVEVPEDQPFILHPGEFVLGQTLERVTLPDDIVARLEGKSSLGRLGLLIHSTAGFVDSGFSGNLTLELSNVANLPITIYHGMPIGQISFMRMDGPVEHPYGSRDTSNKYQGQTEPTPSRFYLNFDSESRS